MTPIWSYDFSYKKLVIEKNKLDAKKGQKWPKSRSSWNRVMILDVTLVRPTWTPPEVIPTPWVSRGHVWIEFWGDGWTSYYFPYSNCRLSYKALVKEIPESLSLSNTTFSLRPSRYRMKLKLERGSSLHLSFLWFKYEGHPRMTFFFFFFITG